jgi:hypothetical protein
MVVAATVATTELFRHTHSFVAASRSSAAFLFPEERVEEMALAQE